MLTNINQYYWYNKNINIINLKWLFYIVIFLTSAAITPPVKTNLFKIHLFNSKYKSITIFTDI